MPLPDNFLSLLFGVLVISFAGAVVFYAVVKDPQRFSRLERLAYCYPLGLSVMAMPMFIASWAGYHAEVMPVVLLTGLAAVIAYGVRRSSPATLWERDPNARPIKAFSEFEWVLFIIIIGCLVVRTMTSLLMPLNDGDGHVIWGFKAKVLYYDTVRTTDLFSRHELNCSNLMYPLLVPFMYAWMSTVVGHWDDMGMFILNPINLIAFAMLVYSTLRRATDRPVALAVTAMLSSLPALLHYSECAQADVPLLLIGGASLFCLFDWIQNRRADSMILAGVLMGGALFTKEEGKIIVVAHSVVAALSIFLAAPRSEYKRLFGHLALYLLIAGLWVLPWLLFQRTIPPWAQYFRPVTWSNIRWGEIPTVIHTSLLTLLKFYNGVGLPKWNILWPIIALYLVVSKSPRTFPWNYLVAAFALHAGGVILVWLCANDPLTLEANEYGWERFTIIMMPALWLLLGKCIDEWWKIWKSSRPTPAQGN